VLEAGCGVGAQTVTLAQRSPEARFTSVDLSGDSIAEARRRADLAGLKTWSSGKPTSSRCLSRPSRSITSSPAVRGMGTIPARTHHRGEPARQADQHQPSGPDGRPLLPAQQTARPTHQLTLAQGSLRSQRGTSTGGIP
jgi:hypothetical protein